MNMKYDVEHSFDLRGLKAGESFLGCPACWYRHSPGIIAKPTCPQCWAKMAIFDMTESDVVKPN